MESQLFLQRARRGWGLAGCALWASWASGCGQDPEGAKASHAFDPVVLWEGQPGLGTALAAGGAVGNGVVWATTPPTAGEKERRLVRCDVPVDDGAGEASCRSFCSGGECPLPTARIVHLLSADAADQEHCFALGSDSSADGSVELVCEEQELSLPVPKGAGETNASDVRNWKMGIDGGVYPTLAVASPKQNAAWYYPASTTNPTRLVPEVDTLPAGYAWDIAVLRLGIDRYNSRLIAVSALEAGQVWLFRSGFPTPEYTLAAGCLGDRPGFGRVLASGDVDGDGLTDLIVADDEFVTAFSGTSLALVGEQSNLGCGFASLPEDAILASVSCASGGLTAGCGDADFAASIAVADLDGDADGELVIGAPGMNVSGKQSGAVLIYDAEGEDPEALTETVVDPDLPEGARFGASIGVLNAKHTDVLAIGAAGSGSLHLASCFAMTRSELRPKRCAAR